VSGVGFKFITPAARFTTRNPRFRGADMTDPSQTIEVIPQRQQLVEFRGNEVYGLASAGFTAWQLGTDGYGIYEAQGESLVKDFRVWHTYDGAIWNYPAARMTIENLTYRIDASASRPSAISAGDYRLVHLTVRGGSIHAGAVFGGNVTDPLGVFTFEGIDAVSYGPAFRFRTPATPGTRATRPPSGVAIVLRGNVVRAWPGQPLRVIAFDHEPSQGNDDLDGPFEVYVFNHQGTAGQNFRAYFKEQISQDIYGGRAPCGNTSARAEVDGVTCAMTGTAPTPPPAAPPPAPTPSVPEPPVPGQPLPPGPPDDESDNEHHCSGRSCPDAAETIGRARPRASGAPTTANSQVGDYDGDGKTDLAIFRPSTGTWHVLTSGSGYARTTVLSFGQAGDIPVPGDYDGDGRTDPAVYRPVDGTWHVGGSAAAFVAQATLAIGQPGDIPVAADYDGDGRTDLALYRPADATWLIRGSLDDFRTATVRRLGERGDVAAGADFDGDGRADPAVYRPLDGTWHVLASTSGAERVYRSGETGGVPVPADYDGDRRADLAVFQPTVGSWRVRTSASSFTDELIRAWGRPGDVPASADYDGDGRADVVTFRQATGEWLVLLSGSRFIEGVKLVHPEWVGAIPAPAVR
jgi:hypothetical protein